MRLLQVTKDAFTNASRVVVLKPTGAPLRSRMLCQSRGVQPVPLRMPLPVPTPPPCAASHPASKPPTCLNHASQATCC